MLLTHRDQRRLRIGLGRCALARPGVNSSVAVRQAPSWPAAVFVGYDGMQTDTKACTLVLLASTLMSTWRRCSVFVVSSRFRLVCASAGTCSPAGVGLERVVRRHIPYARGNLFLSSSLPPLPPSVPQYLSIYLYVYLFIHVSIHVSTNLSISVRCVFCSSRLPKNTENQRMMQGTKERKET